MGYFIKSAVICVGLLLLLLPAHSSGNPLPPRDPRSADSIDRCRQWQLDTNSEIESITQLSNGITVFNEITQPAPAHQSLLNYKLIRLEPYELGLKTVCRMHYLYLRFEIALTNINESDENYIRYSSAKYVAQHAMENACRWVQIVAASDPDNNAAAVRNCTLEDIDAACLEFQRYELGSVIRSGEIATYATNSLGTEIQGGTGSQEDWFNCTHSQSPEHLSHRAVIYILEQIHS